MKPIIVRAAPLAAPLATLLAAASLTACVAPPSTTVLSRLPERTSTPATLTPEERKRYDEIDKQVMREQNAAIAAEEAARAMSYYAPPVTYYGGYYGGWGRGWGTGLSYGYPGWWW